MKNEIDDDDFSDDLFDDVPFEETLEAFDSFPEDESEPLFCLSCGGRFCASSSTIVWFWHR